MGIEEIVRYGANVLSEPTKEVPEFNDEIKQLIEHMYELLADAKGAGLAANQIGLSLRLFVYDDGSGPHALINPKIIKKSGSQIGSEGCLSIPGLFGDVERANVATVTGMDENGKKVKLTGTGYLARIFQHETDHLDGKLFIDLADADSLHWVMPGQEDEEE
ncbi:MAG: peptide deformylase [Armatimonadota bacterium]